MLNRNGFGSRKRSVFRLLLSFVAIASFIAPSQIALAGDVFAVNIATSKGVLDTSRSSFNFGSLNPGTSKTDNLLIQNTGDTSLTLSVLARYSFTSADGTMQLISATSAPAYDSAAWFTFGSSKVSTFTLTVAAGKSSVVPVYFNVPKTAFPGTHTAAVLVGIAGGAGTVNISKRVAIMSTVTVTGSIGAAANPSWIPDATFYEMNFRNFSATKNIKGATARISKLKTLGVAGLIIDPIFPVGTTKMVGTIGDIFSNTKLTAVDPNLGTLADFSAFETAAQTAGMKVILRIPISTISIDADWASSSPDWIVRDDNFAPVTLTGAAYLTSLNYKKLEARQAIIEALVSWAKTYGVDGFVLDGATTVPTDFLNELSFRLQAVGSLLIGTTDPYSKVPFTNSLTFTNNDDLLTLLQNISAGKQSAASYTTTFTALNGVTAPTFYTNYTADYATSAAGTTDASRLGAGLSAALALQFTLPGAPMLFQGQEIGYAKALKPYDPDSITWPKTNPAVFATLQKLINLKQSYSSLFTTTGSPVAVMPSSSTGMLAFKRGTGKTQVLVVVNLTSKALTAKFDPGAAATAYTFSKDAKVSLLKGTSNSVTLTPFGYEIYTPAVVK